MPLPGPPCRQRVGWPLSQWLRPVLTRRAIGRAETAVKIDRSPPLHFFRHLLGLGVSRNFEMHDTIEKVKEDAGLPFELT